jgi:pimeloyl-ACP methyl ester carboxylesterase
VIDLVIDDPGSAHPADVALVWAHGLTSSRSQEDGAGLFPWRSIDGLRVVRYDARGHGASPGPLDEAAYEWPALGADLLAVMDAAGLASAAVGGASMGCASSLYAALAAPARIERLVLVIPPTAWETRAAQVDLYRASAAAVERSGMQPSIDFTRTEPPLAVFGDDGGRIRDDRIRHLERMDPALVATIMRGAARSNLPDPDVLRSITQPALILAWSGDPGHPVSTAIRLAEVLPDAELHVADDLTAIRAWPARVDTFLLHRR